MVKLAVAVAEQASTQSGIEPSQMHCVFSSAIGDAETTDYMCRVLAGPDKLLSPTKFHNSVHNAAAGYWSISMGCEKPATFVGGMNNSFSVALMEAMIQLASENVPVLVVVSDLPVPGPMWDMHLVAQPFAAAFVLTPEPLASSGTAQPVFRRSLQFSTEPVSGSDQDWPLLRTGKLDKEGAASLNALYNSNPSARALSLVDQLLANEALTLNLPLSDGLRARIDVSDSGVQAANRASVQSSGTKKLDDTARA